MNETIDYLHGDRDRAEESYSVRGCARRDAMRRELMLYITRRRRRRAALRRGSIAALLVVAAALVSLFPRPGPNERPAATAPGANMIVAGTPGLSASLAHVRFEVVRDDSAILKRYETAPSPIPAAAFVSDDELLKLLASANRPAGLVRLEGRVFLADTEIDAPTGEPPPSKDG
jgi:hypothetical protein